MRKPIRLSGVSRAAFHVWQRNLDSYKRFYKANLLGSLGEPFLYLFGMGFGLGGYIANLKGVSYMEFIAPGLLMVTAMYTATFECTFGSYTRMVEQKTYDAILATPLSIGDIVFGDILWGATKSLISGSIMLVIIKISGLMNAPVQAFFPLLILIFFTGMLFSAMAMTVTSLSPSYDFFSYYFTLVLAPMFFFSGIFYPLDKFPYLIKAISNLLPLMYAVNISRSIASGSLDYGAILIGVPFLFGLTVIFVVAAITLVEKRLVK
ncbi:MAG: ABC transporter permease [Nitrospinota bacterium]